MGGGFEEERTGEVVPGQESLPEGLKVLGFGGREAVSLPRLSQEAWPWREPGELGPVASPSYPTSWLDHMTRICNSDFSARTQSSGHSQAVHTVCGGLSLGHGAWNTYSLALAPLLCKKGTIKGPAVTGAREDALTEPRDSAGTRRRLSG